MLLRIAPLLLLAYNVPSLLAVQQCKCTDYEPCMEQNQVKKTFAGCMEHCTDKHADPVNTEFSTCMLKQEKPLTKTIDCMYNKLGMGCAKEGLNARSQIKMQILKRNLTEFRELVVTELENVMELKEGDFAHENENSAAVQRCLLRCFYPARNLCTYTYKCGLQFPEEPKMVKMLMDCSAESGIKGQVEESIKKCIGATLKTEDTDDGMFISSASEELLEADENDGPKEVTTTKVGIKITNTIRPTRTRPQTTVTLGNAKINTKPSSVITVTTTKDSSTTEEGSSTTEVPSTTMEAMTEDTTENTEVEETTDTSESTTEESTTVEITDTVVGEGNITSGETTSDPLDSFDEESRLFETGSGENRPKLNMKGIVKAESIVEPFRKQKQRL